MRLCGEPPRAHDLWSCCYSCCEPQKPPPARTWQPLRPLRNFADAEVCPAFKSQRWCGSPRNTSLHAAFCTPDRGMSIHDMWVLAVPLLTPFTILYLRPLRRFFAIYICYTVIGASASSASVRMRRQRAGHNLYRTAELFFISYRLLIIAHSTRTTRGAALCTCIPTRRGPRTRPSPRTTHMAMRESTPPKSPAKSAKWPMPIE